jgi:hypothetical protein
MTEAPQETISRIYNCPKCKKTHSIKLEKNIAEGRRRYPFPHVFLHSTAENLEELLTILYIDAQLQIRAVDIIELEHSNIFSEDMAKEIMEKLMDEIEKLQKENLELKGLLSTIELNESIEIEEENLDLESIILDTEKEIIKAGEEESAEFKEVSENIWKIQSKTPGMRIRAKGEKISLFFISTIGPGEKKQKLTIDNANLIYEIKETVGHIYGLIPANFHLSVGGITLDEMKPLKEYNEIEDGDEVLIIPSSIAG